MTEFDDIFEPNEESKPAFNKEEWIKQQQENRTQAYEMLENATQEITNPDIFMSYLDVQSRFDRYSVSNALLVTYQMPEATRLCDSKTWKEHARQLCGQYSTAKLAAFKDLLESTDDRLIVFFNFNEELFKLKSIVEELEKPVSIVNGSIKDLEAYENESDSITFVQYQAGSMDLNLQKSNKIIYFTLPQSSEHFEQSMKRIHRIGQKNNCFYYLLMVKNSVEEVILETLKMRKDYDTCIKVIFILIIY